MPFSFNPSIEYVKIDESSLYELFQSKSPLVPSDPSLGSRQCEAYICTSKEGRQLRIFVSFLDTVFKQIYVYTPESDPVDAAEYGRLLTEAQEFVSSKGFSVEKVNIDFSSAIRQVIIRSLRVMRPPAASQKKVLHLVSPADKGPAETVAAESSPAPGKQSSTERQTAHLSARVENVLAEKDAALQQVRAELEAAKLEMEALRREQAEQERRASAEYADLRSRFDQAVAARDCAEELMAKAGQQLEQDAMSRDERERLASEIVVLGEKLADALAVREAAEQTEKELISVQHQLAGAVAEKEALGQQLAAEISAGAAALESLRDEMAAMRASFDEERAVNKALIEKLQNESDRAADAANAELSTLTGELAAARASLARLEPLQSELQEARLELAQLSKDNSLVLVELEELAEERKAERAASAEDRARLQAENERLTKSLLIQEQVAQREQTALRAELRAMVAEMAGGTHPSAARAAVSVSPAPEGLVNAAPPAAAEEPLKDLPEQEPEDLHDEEADASSPGVEQALAMLDTGDDGSFGAAGTGSSTEFSLEAGLDFVPYRSSVDVLAVFYSINTVQAVPIGREVQKCSGYVCAVAEGGVPHIYVAWHLAESGRVAVFVPHQQPGDKESCSTVLRDAIQYFEIMGFMMEKHDLGATPQKRRSVLKKIPVLKRGEKGHADHPQTEPLKRSA